MMDELIQALDDMSVVISMYKRKIEGHIEKLDWISASSKHGFGNDSMGDKVASKLTFIRNKLCLALEDAEDLYARVIAYMDKLIYLRDHDGDSHISYGQKTIY